MIRFPSDAECYPFTRATVEFDGGAGVGGTSRKGE